MPFTAICKSESRSISFISEISFYHMQVEFGLCIVTSSHSTLVLHPYIGFEIVSILLFIS